MMRHELTTDADIARGRFFYILLVPGYNSCIVKTSSFIYIIGLLKRFEASRNAVYEAKLEHILTLIGKGGADHRTSSQTRASSAAIPLIEENPFITDRELTRQLKVSIQTVRLDRMELGIPELRERMKLMAERSYDAVRSLPLHEVIGDIVDLQLDQSGISIFEIREEHVFSRTGIARGHHVFAQANSLAVAVINDEIALTSSADIRFVRSVKLGEKCIAKAHVRSISGRRRRRKLKFFHM